MSWNLQFPRARFVIDQAHMDVDLESGPRCSVIDTGMVSQDPADQTLMAFEVAPAEATLPLNIEPLACRDAYVRESDLIATYPQTYPWPFGYQVDFRYRADMPGGIRAMELWFSISTSLLECNPKLHLLPRTRCRVQGSRHVAVAIHGRAALMVHPLDQADCEVVPASDFQGVGHWDVFGGFMEKGVIRRARFLLAWSGSAEPDSKWERALDSFSESPLPLTA